MQSEPARLILFNPDLLSRDELERQFVVRLGLLQALLRDLRRPPGEEGPHHHLIVGPRGMGKTSLLRRLRYAVERDAKLSRWWLPLTFPEEQYGVASLADLWLNCLDALGDVLEQSHRGAEAAEVDALVARVRREQAAHRDRASLDALLDWARRHQRGLLLLLDNIDLVLDRLKDDQWSLREVLTHQHHLVVIGTSSAAIEATYTYDQAFYDFFEIHELRGLNLDETRTLLSALSESTGFPDVMRVLDGDPGRLETLHVLTGGSPRAIALLFQVMVTHDAGEIDDDVERLLDQVTPLYKARVEALPDQAQRIFHALALHWDPMTAAEVADAAALPSSSQASAQLDRLSREGLVEQVRYPSGGRAGYQIAERFFNIWYLMRASRRVRRRLIWLVEFLKLFYGAKTLEHQTRELVRCVPPDNEAGRMRRAELLMAYAQASQDSALAQAAEFRALETLWQSQRRARHIDELDLKGEDRHFQPFVERLKASEECLERIRTARSDWPIGSSDHFWEVLEGSPSVTWQDRRTIVTLLPQISDADLQDITRDLESEEGVLKRAFGTKAAQALRDAKSSGLVGDLNDQEGARAAAIRLGCSMLPELVEGSAAALALKDGSALSRILGIDHSARSVPPRTAHGWAKRAELLTAVGSHSDAAIAYRRAVELDSNDARLWFGYAFLLSNRLQQYEDAEDAYRRGLELDSNAAYPWVGLGMVLQELHQPGEAEAAYRRSLALDSSDTFAWTSLGNLYANLGRNDEAEAGFRHAIQIRPDYGYAWVCLGSLLTDLQRPEEAEHALRRATQLAPEDKFVWLILGRWLVRQERYKEAEGALRHTITVDAEFDTAWVSLADLLAIHLERYEEAETAYRKAIALDGEQGSRWNNLGNVLDHLERFDEAEMAYRRAIELEPAYAGHWFNLAHLYHHHLKRYDEAQHAYATAIKLNPDYVQAWNRLGDLLHFCLGDYDQAEAAHRRAIEADPENSEAWGRQAHLLLYHLGRPSESEHSYRKAVVLDPCNGQWRRGLAQALLQQDRDLHGAVEMAREGLRLADDEYEEWLCTWTLGTVLVRLDQWQEAADLMRGALKGEEWIDDSWYWPSMLSFFTEAVRKGSASASAALLDELELSDRWRPLRVALQAAAEQDPEVLYRVAPEVRGPAQELLEQLWPEGKRAGKEPSRKKGRGKKRPRPTE